MSVTNAAPPEFDRTQLAAGAAQLGLALTVGQVDNLERFGALLRHWNRTHNLTRIDAGEALITHHLLDSLAVARPLQLALVGARQQPARVLDVGAGGGLPGVPLAVACPDLRFTLVDAVQKKTAFLTQAVLELGLRNVEVRHARVESMQGEFDVITARAFASLADFVARTRHLLAPGGRWFAMKGRVDAAELAALPASVVVGGVLPLAVPGLEEERHLIEVHPT